MHEGEFHVAPELSQHIAVVPERQGVAGSHDHAERCPQGTERVAGQVDAAAARDDADDARGPTGGRDDRGGGSGACAQQDNPRAAGNALLHHPVDRGDQSPADEGDIEPVGGVRRVCLLLRRCRAGRRGAWTSR